MYDLVGNPEDGDRRSCVMAQISGKRSPNVILVLLFYYV